MLTISLCISVSPFPFLRSPLLSLAILPSPEFPCLTNLKKQYKAKKAQNKRMKEGEKKGRRKRTSNIPHRTPENPHINPLKPSNRLLAKNKIRHAHNLTPRKHLCTFLRKHRVLIPFKRTPIVPATRVRTERDSLAPLSIPVLHVDVV